MTKSAVTLDDKYTQDQGRVFMSAIQALTRLPLDQARRDAARGKRTAGFISGYRGSPIGTYDAALWAAKALLDRNHITFLPGLNEELAATAVRGTQELDWMGKSEFEGVFGLWYGKHVGADRGMEALKLGNLEGSSPSGGVLVVAADDHGGKSSASAQGSEHALIAAIIPILYPADAAEIIAFGLLGWEMSRYSGLYVALKTVTDTLDFSSSVPLPDPHRDYVRPAGFALPPEGLGLRQMRSPLAQEDWAVNRRLPAAQAFARANGVDRVVIDAPRRVLSILAAGKVYRDVRQALDDLGLDDAACAAFGIRLYKPGLVWPLEPEGLIDFARGSRELLIVEEKRAVIEEQAARILFALPEGERPQLTGKRDTEGQALLSSVGELSPTSVREALVRRLKALDTATNDLIDRAQHYAEMAARARRIGGGAKLRPAYYCSGCPHNTGTRLPDGSIAISAVGCHGLAAFMPERRTLMPMPMGGDGIPWVSAGPLVDRPHMFQNMGDGTYAHSGVLAIRQAVAAKANMTFKILYNDAVAMTGGQPVEGAPTPLDIVHQLLAENVAPVVIVTDQPEDFSGDHRPPPGVAVHHRDELDTVQRDLRERKGVSGLVYVQTCAAEKRRRRKKGAYPDPDKRVFINAAVCEGCGDCSVQSNCVSIQPLETEFGRKRKIDQSSCNKDFSCIKGFCPSFVTVEGARIAKRGIAGSARFDALIADLPRPAMAGEGAPYSVLITGIGGTGVLTVGAVLGMAAHLDGKGCTVMDQTGMAQKGGAVTSHLRIASDQNALHTARLDVGMTDLIVGCDLVVASHPDVLKTVKPGVTSALLNADVTPTGEFQTNRDADMGEHALRAVVAEALGGGAIHDLHATRLATTLTGDSIATNFLMLGYALQKGLLPVSLEALEEAIRLNGSNAAGNLRTLALGRLAAVRPDAFDQADPAADLAQRLATVSGVVESRTALLTDYQNAAYAAEYRSFIEEIAETAKRCGAGDAEEFVRTAALGLAKVMAYKDEYEVARLHADPRFREALTEQFEGDFRMSYYLAPPLLSRTDPGTGRPRKIRFGSWAGSLFGVLSRFKGLRGTAFDLFGYTAERREERALIGEYRALVCEVASRLTKDNLSAAIQLVGAVMDVRGYGPVKHASLQAYRARLPDLRAAFEAAGAERREPVFA
jgi:indolepyruvate ferredoxin oxidoreductase